MRNANSFSGHRLESTSAQRGQTDGKSIVRPLCSARIYSHTPHASYCAHTDCGAIFFLQGSSSLSYSDKLQGTQSFKIHPEAQDTINYKAFSDLLGTARLPHVAAAKRRHTSSFHGARRYDETHACGRPIRPFHQNPRWGSSQRATPRLRAWTKAAQWYSRAHLH